MKEVYDQVLSDLLEAERLYSTLPVEKQFTQDYRTNLPMVELLLSRVYLYLENWEKAAVYAEKEIKNNKNNHHEQRGPVEYTIRMEQRARQQSIWAVWLCLMPGLRTRRIMIELCTLTSGLLTL